MTITFDHHLAILTEDGDNALSATIFVTAEVTEDGFELDCEIQDNTPNARREPYTPCRLIEAFLLKRAEQLCEAELEGPQDNDCDYFDDSYLYRNYFDDCVERY